MSKSIIFKAVLLLGMLSSILTAHAKTPDYTFIVTDNSGMEFTIEFYPDDPNLNSGDFVFYKNSDPSTKIYGHGTDLRRGFFYINTDSPLFDIEFANGMMDKLQPFKNICYLYYTDGDYFFAPKDTKDPGWRIPYVVH